MSPSEAKTLDQFVWDAHFHHLKKALQIPVSLQIWRKYWKAIRQDCRGYWHGATGLIAERLNIKAEEWEQMIKLHQAGRAACLGDSSHDYSYLVEKAGNNFREGVV